jgi:hypothetical protein
MKVEKVVEGAGRRYVQIGHRLIREGQGVAWERITLQEVYDICEIADMYAEFDGGAHEVTFRRAEA